MIGGPGAKVTRSHIVDSYSDSPKGFGGIYGAEVVDSSMERNVHDVGGRPVPDLAVAIEHYEWDDFQGEAFILELKVRVTNQTPRKKTVKVWQLRCDGRESSVSLPTQSARQEVARRRDTHQQLLGQSRIDPRESIVGWLVYALPWSPAPGPTTYMLSVEDELNQQYVAMMDGP